MTEIEGFTFPDDLYYYPKWHIWAKVEEDGNVRIGLTESGQNLAKNILFVRIKAPGTSVAFNTVLGTLESSKWVGSIRSPINGTILESNPRIKKNPSLINEEPYGEGWIAVLKPTRLEEDLANLKFGEKALEAFKGEIFKKKLKKE